MNSSPPQKTAILASPGLGLGLGLVLGLGLAWLPASAAEASQPVTRIAEFMIWFAKMLQTSAMAIAVSGLIVISIKTIKDGREGIEGSKSWVGAMFLIATAGHIIEFFTGTSAFTGSDLHLEEVPTIYQEVKTDQQRTDFSPGDGSIFGEDDTTWGGPYAAPTPGWGSLWGPGDNIWGEQPGSGKFWPRQEGATVLTGQTGQGPDDLGGGAGGSGENELDGPRGPAREGGI